MTAFEYLFGVKDPTKKEFNKAVQFLEFILGEETTICTCTDANRIMTLKQALFWERGWNLKDGYTDAFFTPNGLKRGSKVRNSANVEKLNTSLLFSRIFYVKELTKRQLELSHLTPIKETLLWT